MIYAALLIPAIYGVLVLIHWRRVSATRTQSDAVLTDLVATRSALAGAEKPGSAEGSTGMR